MVVYFKVVNGGDEDTHEEGRCATVVFSFCSIGYNTITHSIIYMSVKRVLKMALNIIIERFIRVPPGSIAYVMIIKKVIQWSHIVFHEPFNILLTVLLYEV